MLSDKPLITLFEQQFFEYQQLGLSTNDPLLEALEAINPQKKEIVRLERKGIRALQHVGVIQVNGRTVQILPKIDFDPAVDEKVPFPGEDRSTTAARNLIYMLISING